MITKIGTVAVYVENQAGAVEFWTGQVGFTVHAERPMGPGASWIEVGPAGAQSCLVIYPKAMMPDWAGRQPSIVFDCADVQQTFEDLKEKGVRFSQEPKELGWGPFAIFHDTDGNWFGLRSATGKAETSL